MRTLTATQLRNFMDAQGIMPWNGGQIADREYILLDEQWLYGRDLHNSFLKFRREFGIDQYLPEENDCDDSDEDLRWWIRTLHRKTKDRKPRTAPAICSFWYLRDRDALRHAIAAGIVERAGGLALAFIEPHYCSPLTLTQQEILSCDAYRF